MVNPSNSERNFPRVLRNPGLNEKRCIVRHALGFYTALVVAGVYERVDGEAFSTSVAELDKTALFHDALRVCADEHPILSAVIDNEDSEHPSFRLVSELDFSKHLRVLDAPQKQEPGAIGNVGDEDQQFKVALESIHNTSFDDVSAIPPWKVYIAPLSHRSSTPPLEDATIAAPRRLLVAYAFSHSHGDGLSGLLFHNIFLQALNKSRVIVSTGTSRNKVGVGHYEQRYKVKADHKLPPALDAPNPLPISWSYLLATILKEFIPEGLFRKFIFNPWSQLQNETNTLSKWTGFPAFCRASGPVHSAAHVFHINAATLRATLGQCKIQQAKLTGTLHQIITYALCTELSREGIEVSSLQSATAINICKALRTPSNVMGVRASTLSREIVAIKPPAPTSISPGTPISSIGISISTDSEAQESEKFWNAARATTTALAEASSTLSDQPIGLLRYLRSFRSWHTDKINKDRDTAYEISNLMKFERGSNLSPSSPSSSSSSSSPLSSSNSNSTTVKLEKLLFSQPADVTGPAMSFNVVSVPDGDLVVVISWQIGALGVVRDVQNKLPHRHAPSLSSSSSSSPRRYDHREAEVDIDLEDTERKFVARVARSIEMSFSIISGQ